MSKLYINDLEDILKGKIVRYSLEGSAKSNSLVPLSIVNNEITEKRNFRLSILDLFNDDIAKVLEENGYDEKIVYQPEGFFFGKDKMSLDIIGNDKIVHCLVSKDGLMASSYTDKRILEIINLILPIVRKLLEIRKNTNALENDFYEDLSVLNEKKEHVLTMSGGGINLPFYKYDDLDDIEIKKTLEYYYLNYGDILKNILIDNENRLGRFIPDREPEKILKLYKETK